ncbi:hypothetical protein GF386_03150 [Candidatus Pacearchaeota archaeon]|nr:hypothetical protein [Candidatus Pacearchaeota archaeon]MBD3283137.1 hypothetical protein [Candidatus Pacearchaeota archaeon]
MFKSQKHVFWQALLVTVLIFSLGLIMGFILENWRTSKISFLSEKSEIDLLDAKLLNDIYSREDFNCQIATEENLNFADRIYQEAKILDRYESASRLTESIQLQHKKYDILRAMLLLNSIKVQEKCGNPYNEVVYFYSYEEEDITRRAKQNVFSKLLKEVKDRKGSDVLLIPIAGNIGSPSISLLMDRYNVSEEDLPIILINRDIRVSDVENIEDLMEYFE